MDVRTRFSIAGLTAGIVTRTVFTPPAARLSFPELK